MSEYRIYLAVSDATHQKITDISTRINAGEITDLSKPLGEALTTLTCEVLDQVFGVLLQTSSEYQQLASQVQETEKVLQQIHHQLQKYMPWAIGLFNNHRLKPVANHIVQHFDDSYADRIYLYYIIEPHLAEFIAQANHAVVKGDHSVLPQLFKTLIEVIDTGVTELIRKPKTMLKFNFVADKTLNGVIHMVTSMGYTRIEKVGQHLPVASAQQYIEYFYGFIRQQ